MIKHILNKVKAATRDIHNPTERSHLWPKIQHEHLAQFPTCASCGSGKKVQVHHKKPFHLHPELELNPDNLISLCMDNDCHILIGHGSNFKAYNPDVVNDSMTVKENVALLKEVAAAAKAKRLFE